MALMWTLLTVYLFSLVVPNEAGLFSKVDSLAEAKEQLGATLKSIEDSHENLRQATSQLGETITSSEKYALDIMAEASKNVCDKGMSEGAAAMAEGSACLLETVAVGVFVQATTQVHCFEEMARYAVRIGVLGVELAKCTVDVKCHAKVLGDAGTEEVENMALVNQKLNHVWEAKKTVEDGMGGCMKEFYNKMEAVQKVCDSANATDHSEDSEDSPQ